MSNSNLLGCREFIDANRMYACVVLFGGAGRMPSEPNTGIRIDSTQLHSGGGGKCGPKVWNYNHYNAMCLLSHYSMPEIINYVILNAKWLAECEIERLVHPATHV